MPDQPTYEDVAKFAEVLNNKAAGFYGIALRGQPGCGKNMATVDTIANTFGATWFDMDWHPRAARNFRQPYLNATVTRSQEYACNLLNGAIFTVRSNASFTISNHTESDTK